MVRDIMDNAVSGLATGVITAQAITASMVGVFGTGFIAGYCEAHSIRGRMWRIAFLLLAARIPLLLGCIGMGLIAGRATRNLPAFPAYATITISIIGSLWLSHIAVQVVQNAVGRFFGAKAKPIRWWAGRVARRGRRRRS